VRAADGDGEFVDEPGVNEGLVQDSEFGVEGEYGYEDEVYVVRQPRKTHRLKRNSLRVASRPQFQKNKQRNTLC
jgi:hypothetical protein